ncbi:tudor domain-containing protein 15 isoform X2 [Hippoglossus hippoglossus]|uniref:tudor domain-containing protein 15 isoform X2 n=1 Tax=Hippoglossus hippoglossus TaxID=8267 RepID=UPI00148C55D1|nr:tudor domain-containing protein 15 isoform X2 [Hippoglossus hippoglossus]
MLAATGSGWNMSVTDAAAGQSLGSRHQESQNPRPSASCALWPVDLKLTHMDWNPEATLIHFQGQYLTICELDYTILQGEIQNIPKTKAAVDIGEFCLVEDLTSARWFRGRVQNRREDLFDVFLIDHGNVLSVDVTHVSSCSNDLFILPPKIVCGFLANVLLLPSCSHAVVEQYFSNLIGRNVSGDIQALLPHKVLLLEAPDINSDLVRHGFGRHVDTDTFLLLVEMLTEVPLKQNMEPVPDLLIEKPRGHDYRFKLAGFQGFRDTLSFCRPRLSCGTRAKVRVTAAVNPRLFHCQMANMKTDLWEMSNKLASVCEYRTKDYSQKTPENLGLLCSVKSKDGKWNRGYVQCLPINSQLRVFLIDYGYFESIKVENVLRLPSDLCSTPIMAFPCSLSCLRDQDEAVKPQQLSLLRAGLLGEVLDVDIRSYDEEQHLYTVTLFGAEDADVKEPEQERLLKGVESVSEAEELSPQGGFLYYETIMGGALDKTLEAEEVQEDSVFVGYVEHVQNPNHFWIRTQKRNEEFEEMMTKMEDHFSQVKLEEDVLVDPELGAQCCAVYEKDMHFYRGVVTDTLEHGAEVLFIDFGNIEKVPHMLIKKIPEAFARKSAFAFCCTLVNVFPLDEVWTSTSSDAFRQAVSNKALLVHVVQRRKNKFVVDLYEMGQDNSQSISDLLITSEQVECWKVTTESLVHNNTKATENSKCPRHRLTSDIGRKTKQSESYEEEENTCKNEIKKSRAPVSFKALSVKPGFEFAVQCTNIESSSDFWCQPKDKGPALEELMDKIQKHYSTSTSPVESGVECCVAKSLDGRWYRAFITDKHNDHASVMLIDYGLSIWVQEHHLQAIMPEYVDLEGQAFRCSFSTLIEPTDPESCGNWGPEACRSVRKFVQDSAGGLRCNVVSHLIVQNKGFYNVVDLYNTQTQQNLTSWLVKQGLATAATISTRQLSTVSPETFVYSSYDLSPGNEEQVYVTHVSNQWEVYCHLERNSEIIEELEKKISEESEKMMQASTRAVVRKLCLGKYFDGKCYRVLAHPVPSPLHLSVFFVDYGNKSISEKTQVTFIPRDCVDLLYTPMQALRCRLASVSEEELYADVKEWLDRTILNKQVRAVVVGRREDGSFDVVLFDGDVNINEKVKELVLSLSPKQKTVVSSAPAIKKTEVKTPHKGNAKIPVKSTSQRKGKSSSHRGAQVGNAPPKKKEDTKNCVHGKVQNKNTKMKQPNDNKTKSSAPEKTRRSSEVKQQRDKDTNSEKPQNTKKTEIPQLPRLPDKNISAGLRTKCFVSHINSINSFFLHLADDEPAIVKMCEGLNSSTFRSSLKSVVSVRIKDLVLAVYEEDGALYRSVVKRSEGSSSFAVEFVDYGNSAVVEKEKIHLIPEEHLSQPRFSLSCCLVDTSAFENDASFTDAVMETPVMVDFVRQAGTQWKVKLQILDGEVDLPAALEAVVETGPENKEEDEEEEESPVTSTKMEQEMTSEENHLRAETSVNETTTSERVVQSVAKCQNVSLPNKLKVKTCRRLRSRITKKRGMKRNRRETSTSSDKAMNDCTDAFIPPSVQAKDRENGTVLSVLSDGDFYVRLARTSFLLDALDRFTAENLCRCEPVADEDVKQGLECFVQVPTDNTWQRAVVQHVGEERCNVLLVDHGITEEIPNASIRRQCGDLTRIPNLAVLCRINCFGFSEREETDKSWCETLKPLIGKDVSVVFVRFSGAENLWMVELVVNGLFIMNQHDERIPSEAGTQNDPNASRPQRLVFAPIDLDSGYFGFAAAVTTPCEFSVVLEDFLLITDKVSVMLEELPEQTSPLPDAHIVQGTCCLLKSDSKNKWCRTEIVNTDAAVVLNLVDYGHCESVPLKHCSELRMLPEELIKLPKVTYPCILRGVKPAADAQWTDEAADFFQQCLNQKNLQIFFREFVSHAHWKVDILADGAHVARELVEAGHADYVDVMLGLRFQELIPCIVPLSSDSERASEQEVEASDGTSDPSAEEDEGRKLLSSLSGSTRCDVM